MSSKITCSKHVSLSLDPEINEFFFKFNLNFNIFKITTVLANMTMIENCRKQIAELNGIDLLVDFLNENILSYDNSSDCLELSAFGRVLQKSAIAISRFCKETKYCAAFVELNGIPKLKKDKKLIIKKYFNYLSFESFNLSLNPLF